MPPKNGEDEHVELMQMKLLRQTKHEIEIYVCSVRMWKVRELLMCCFEHT